MPDYYERPNFDRPDLAPYLEPDTSMLALNMPDGSNIRLSAKIDRGLANIGTPEQIQRRVDLLGKRQAPTTVVGFTPTKPEYRQAYTEQQKVFEAQVSDLIRDKIAQADMGLVDNKEIVVYSVGLGAEPKEAFETVSIVRDTIETEIQRERSIGNDVGSASDWQVRFVGMDINNNVVETAKQSFAQENLPAARSIDSPRISMQAVKANALDVNDLSRVVVENGGGSRGDIVLHRNITYGNDLAVSGIISRERLGISEQGTMQEPEKGIPTTRHMQAWQKALNVYTQLKNTTALMNEGGIYVIEPGTADVDNALVDKKAELAHRFVDIDGASMVMATDETTLPVTGIYRVQDPVRISNMSFVDFVDRVESSDARTYSPATYTADYTKPVLPVLDSQFADPIGVGASDPAVFGAPLMPSITIGILGPMARARDLSKPKDMAALVPGPNYQSVGINVDNKGKVNAIYSAQENRVTEFDTVASYDNRVAVPIARNAEGQEFVVAKLRDGDFNLDRGDIVRNIDIDGRKVKAIVSQNGEVKSILRSNTAALAVASLPVGMKLSDRTEVVAVKVDTAKKQPVSYSVRYDDNGTQKIAEITADSFNRQFVMPEQEQRETIAAVERRLYERFDDESAIITADALPVEHVLREVADTLVRDYDMDYSNIKVIDVESPEWDEALEQEIAKLPSAQQESFRWTMQGQSVGAFRSGDNIVLAKATHSPELMTAIGKANVLRSQGQEKIHALDTAIHESFVSSGESHEVNLAYQREMTQDPVDSFRSDQTGQATFVPEYMAQAQMLADRQFDIVEPTRYAESEGLDLTKLQQAAEQQAQAEHKQVEQLRNEVVAFMEPRIARLQEQQSSQEVSTITTEMRTQLEQMTQKYDSGLAHSMALALSNGDTLDWDITQPLAYANDPVRRPQAISKINSIIDNLRAFEPTQAKFEITKDNRLMPVASAQLNMAADSAILSDRILDRSVIAEDYSRRLPGEGDRHFDISVGETGAQEIKAFIDEEHSVGSRPYVGFGDMSKVAAMNKGYSSRLVDVIIPASVKVADEVLQREGGRAARIGGDEIGIVLPGSLTEERVDQIRKEAQQEVSKIGFDRFAMAKVEGITIENKAAVATVVRTSLGNAVINDLYEDEDGYFIIYDKQGLDLDASVGYVEKVLASAGIVEAKVSEPYALFSPRVSFGMDRAEQLETTAASYGAAITKGEFILNVSKENNRNGGMGRDYRRELARFEASSTTMTKIPAATKKEIVLGSAKSSGIKVYADQVEPYYPAFNRETLGGIVAQAYNNDQDVTLIRIDTRYVPRGEFANEVKQAITDGKFTVDALRGKEDGTFGFKVVNEFSDHEKANEVILTQANIYRSEVQEELLKNENVEGAFLVRGPPDNFYLAVVTPKYTAVEPKVFVEAFEAAERKINADADVEADIQITANLVSTRDVGSNTDVLIGTVDKLATVETSIPVNNRIKAFDPAKEPAFKTELALLRVVGRNMSRQVLEDKFGDPSAIPDSAILASKTFKGAAHVAGSLVNKHNKIRDLMGGDLSAIPKYERFKASGQDAVIDMTVYADAKTVEQLNNEGKYGKKEFAAVSRLADVLAQNSWDARMSFTPQNVKIVKDPITQQMSAYIDNVAAVNKQDATPRMQTELKQAYQIGMRRDWPGPSVIGPEASEKYVIRHTIEAEKSTGLKKTQELMTAAFWSGDDATAISLSEELNTNPNIERQIESFVKRWMVPGRVIRGEAVIFGVDTFKDGMKTPDELRSEGKGPLGVTNYSVHAAGVDVATIPIKGGYKASVVYDQKYGAGSQPGKITYVLDYLINDDVLSKAKTVDLDVVDSGIAQGSRTFYEVDGKPMYAVRDDKTQEIVAAVVAQRIEPKHIKAIIAAKEDLPEVFKVLRANPELNVPVIDVDGKLLFMKSRLPEASSQRVMSQLKVADPKLAVMLQAQPSKTEDSLEVHATKVMNFSEDYLHSVSMPAGFDRDAFEMTLGLHDIGKVNAIQQGSRGNQHAETEKIVRSLSQQKQIPLNEQQTRIALALIDGDPIGRYMQGIEPSVQATSTEIKRMADQSGMPARDFFKVLTMYYQSDAGSYSTYAGGGGATDYLFDYDQEQGSIEFDSARQRLRFTPQAESRFVALERDLFKETAIAPDRAQLSSNVYQVALTETLRASEWKNVSTPRVADVSPRFVYEVGDYVVHVPTREEVAQH
ncbi:MAG: hypothetical protein KJ736_12210 [Candidatus Omnitrophica bacterium]|nr:hypothetical protein [Candidatus Omnitrophota bacterium]